MSDREFINNLISVYFSSATDPYQATLNNAVVNRLNDIANKLEKQEKENAKYKQLEEQLNCPLEEAIKHINESYKMLCQHIEINEKYVELKKYRDIVELSKISYDIALSKEQKGLCEKYFTWLKKDKSE